MQTYKTTKFQIKKIKLSQGKYALVDNEDYEYLSKFTWHYHINPKDKYGYAVSSTPPLRNKKMHRVLLMAKTGQLVDHKNRNGLDNQKNNLRIVTKSESMRNRKLPNRYNYVGVGKTVDRSGEPKYWIARITVKGKRIYLGTFTTGKEAAKAYNKAIDKYFNGVGVKNNV